jgi:predicted nucleic-acid-binding Zn-ribbon protein
MNFTKKQLKKNRIETDEDGIPCPRCGDISIVREHIEITEKLLSQPFYYSKWYICKNKHCKTTIFYDEGHRVYPKLHRNVKITGNRDKYLNTNKHTTLGSDLSINQEHYSSTPPWLTDKEYEAELRLKAIKEQLKIRG